MFGAWGRVLSRRRRLTLVITLLFVAFAAAWGTGVFGKLSSGDNFTPPASQSQREANLADQVFGRNDADVVVLYRSAAMTVTDPAYRQAVTTALNSLPRADVAKGTAMSPVASYDPNSGNVYVTGNSSAVWNTSATWANSAVWGSSEFVAGASSTTMTAPPRCPAPPRPQAPFTSPSRLPMGTCPTTLSHSR